MSQENIDSNQENKINLENLDPAINEAEKIHKNKSFVSKLSSKALNEEIGQLLVGEDQNKTRLVKKNTIYKRTKMANFGLKLSNFYSQMPTWKLLSITIITAIVFGVISVFLVKNVGIYNFGLAAFGQAFSRLLVVLLSEGSVSLVIRNLLDQFVFWLAYIILSIPIFIFGYKKIGKSFSDLTVLFLVVSSVVSFSLGFIPKIGNVYLIGDFSNTEIQKSLTNWQKPLSGIIPLNWKDGGNIIALFIFAIVYGYLLAWIFAIIQIIGGTAGVTGIIGEWYSNTKQKSFGSISGYINIIIVLIGVLIGSWLPGSLLLDGVSKNPGNLSAEKLSQINSLKWSFQLYLSPNFVATILSNIVYIIILNKLYPKFKLVRVEIYSMNMSLEIARKIKRDKKIVTGVSLFKAKGGYSKNDIDVVTSITLFRQVNRIIKDVRKIDPDAFISISNVTSIDGYIYLPQDKF
ncbi:uncharacterized membrane-anchored protein YitT (DUF2179 family) [Mycoplasmopsis mustelae]|uniref:Uncharacterized membrane-anchored protein YitT (DUF2179 family) n=1 Tax=Mycoplasmopsis mustelae TaxID=171289 RepID=A0A4R7UCN0_9BACT|nr:DUF2179 domain-containing protein [Mycoplasmopsis mustelae]TDV22854.1 uncharacterized membrane-anchored protein YitT (DUF2179 family) [Mycoplasmopsis mustelae]